jgi:hypothetical protein
MVAGDASIILSAHFLLELSGQFQGLFRDLHRLFAQSAETDDGVGTLLDFQIGGMPFCGLSCVTDLLNVIHKYFMM